MYESDSSFVSEQVNDSEACGYGNEQYTLSLSITDVETYTDIRNLKESKHETNGKIKEQNNNCQIKKKECNENKLPENRYKDRDNREFREENQNKILIKEKRRSGILVKDINDLFCTIFKKEKNQKKVKMERNKKEKYKDLTNVNSYVSSSNKKIYTEQRKRKGECDQNRKHDSMNKDDRNENNDKKRRCSAIKYKVLCKTQKMNVIDMIEDPVIAKELVDIVKKVQFKVHWEEDTTQCNNNNNKEKRKTTETNKSNKGNKNEKTNKIVNNNETKKGILKNNINKKKSIKSIIKHSKKEHEFDAAIDLLKSYYGLKETDIYYISDDGKSLLPGSVLVYHKIININLSDNKNIKINIDSIRKIDDYISEKKYPNLKNINSLNLIAITYEPMPQKNI